VTKPFLPPVKEYKKIIEGIFERGVLTNQGPCLQEFEEKIKAYLNVEHFQFLCNGTVALQLALSALGITEGEVITTPFSYVATTSSILWERCEPVFVDVEPDNFTIDAAKIEKAVTPRTKAIMAVHVFGYACDVGEIQAIAVRHNLKVVYDGAHAFGVEYLGNSLLSYGDITTVSFHATKLFHTGEGGGCIIKDSGVAARMELQKRFGHQYDDHRMLGINGKTSELNAAMGLANFPYINEIIADRQRVSVLYDKLLPEWLQRPKSQTELEYNYAYYPVVFRSEEQLLRVFDALKKEEIFPRRYFYPSLNTLPYIQYQPCPVSEDISNRIACLPLYVGLEEATIEKIADTITGNYE